MEVLNMRIQSIDIRLLEASQGTISKKKHSNNRDIQAYSSIIQHIEVC